MLESFGKSFASGNRTRRSATSRNRCSTFIFMHWRPQLRSHRLHSGFASHDSAAPATGAALTHTSEGALERGERVDLVYDSAADLLRLRLLELPTAQTEEVDSNAVIDWASDGRIVGLEVFGLTVFFAKPALRTLLEDLDRLNLLSSEISVFRGPPDRGGYLAETVGIDRRRGHRSDPARRAPKHAQCGLQQPNGV